MSSVAESLKHGSETEACPTFPSFRLTSKTLYGLDTVVSTKASVTSFLAGFPVSLSLWPESAKGPQTSAICGPQPSSASLSYDPDSRSWKTFQGLLAPDISIESSVILPRQGMTVAGEFYPQPKWARPISEIGSGLWATPQARDYRTGEAHRWKDDRRSNNLNDQVAFFATPSTDGMDGGSNQRKTTKRNGTYVTHPGGKLNPEFVEWLQNWPRGWTALTPLPRERFDEWLHSDWWAEEPADMSRLTDSVPNRTKRIMALGNGQVSRCAAVAWLLLTQEEGDE